MAQNQLDQGFWVNPNPPIRPRSAPQSHTGVVGWLRDNLFQNIWNTLLTIVVGVLLYLALTSLIRWVFTEALWLPVWVNRKLFAVGRYPWERIAQPVAVLWIVSILFGLSAGRWGSFMRTLAIGLAALMGALALLPLFPSARIALAVAVALIIGFYLVGHFVRIPSRWLTIAWIVSLPVNIWILRGGLTIPFVGPVTFGEDMVSFSLFGGLMLTILLTVVGIAFSFPIGVLLALGRRSKMPVVKYASVGYIELIRGVPMITLLFMFMIAMPLVLPSGVTAPENAVRAMIAIVAFEAAYAAENVRGGMQSVSHGQYEAASALGLGTIQSLRLIILPQALRAVIPAIVGQFISLFKDTSLVTLVSLYELVGIAQVVIQQQEWMGIPGGISREVYVFVATVFFIFSYGMSYASRRLEKQLGVGRR